MAFWCLWVEAQLDEIYFWLPFRSGLDCSFYYKIDTQYFGLIQSLLKYFKFDFKLSSASHVHEQGLIS